MACFRKRFCQRCGVGSLQQRKRIERQLVVRAVRVGGVDDAIEQVHAGAPVPRPVGTATLGESWHARIRRAARISNSSVDSCGLPFQP